MYKSQGTESAWMATHGRMEKEKVADTHSHREEGNHAIPRTMGGI